MKYFFMNAPKSLSLKLKTLKIYKLLSIVLISSSLNSCVYKIKTADRPELKNEDTLVVQRESAHPSLNDSSGVHVSHHDYTKYAYELGYDPTKGLNEEQKSNVMLRARVRGLERTLDSMKERIQYSKVVPYLQSDKEKFELLSIPSIEGRQAYVNKHKIMNRGKSKTKDYLEIVEQQDIALGMTQDLVKQSWGDPESIDYSGHPIYKNERWRYIRDVPTVQGYKRERRYVYFEGGRVVGWETE